jgi:hypothetical protein
MYFSASEWTFCPMCEWQCGHSIGEDSGGLMFMGGTVELFTRDIMQQNAISITRAGLDELFRAPATKSWTGLIQTWHWEKFKPARDTCRKATSGSEESQAEDYILLNRDQLHNLLMHYGSPNGCLTDELWASLKSAWPCP